jgi:hypothetical protein
MHETYERKTRGPGSGTEGRTPIQITVSVEPTTPCATNTPERTPTFRQLNFSGRRETRQGSNQGKSTGGESSGSNSQLSTPHGGSSSTQFKMAGQDPTIRLPEFQGEASKDPEKNLFIYEKIWEENRSQMRIQISQLAITLRDHALDWYMSLDVNNPHRSTKDYHRREKTTGKRVSEAKLRRPVHE